MNIKAYELGCPGHFIAARLCRWRRHTQVGNYRVSSVGDYYSPVTNQRERLGAGDESWFETMVFKTTTIAPDNDGCQCREVESWSELDGQRSATSGEANATHERMVAKYRKLARNEAGK